ncbi:hypothetical protein [Nostoc sp.]
MDTESCCGVRLVGDRMELQTSQVFSVNECQRHNTVIDIMGFVDR